MEKREENVKSVQYGTWLGAAREEEIKQGVDHYELACYPGKLTPYVGNHLDEADRLLTGVRGDLPDFPVEEQDQREYWEGGREAYIGRLREVLDHLGAALVAVGCTDKQLHLAKPPSDKNSDEASVVLERICVICEKPLSEGAPEPLVLHDGVFLCGEKCEDEYDGVGTVVIRVSDVAQALAEKKK